MFLRKYLSGGKVLFIRQHGLERILIFDIGKGQLIYRLIIELFDEGNMILTDEAYRIIKPLRTTGSRTGISSRTRSTR